MAKAKNVWVIIHCEFMGGSKSPHVDEMVFHVSSNLHQVKRFLRTTHVAPYSWWKIQQFCTDIRSDAPRTLIYTHTARRVKDAPWNLAKFRYIQYARKEGW